MNISSLENQINKAKNPKEEDRLLKRLLEYAEERRRQSFKENCKRCGREFTACGLDENTWYCPDCEKERAHKEDLFDMYVNKKMELGEIAKACYIKTEGTIVQWLRKYGIKPRYGKRYRKKIERRPLSEAHKEKVSLALKGKPDRRAAMHRAELVGKKINMLTIIKDLNRKDEKNNALLLCECECGNMIELPTNCLNTSSTKCKPKYSCGCSRRPLPLREKIHPAMQRLSHRMCKTIYKILKGEKKGTAWTKLVGYTSKELRAHLESQFTSNMSWDNYGTYWVVDHIIPRRVFDQRNKLEMMLCWALPNLQPMERHKNDKKGGKVNYYSEEFYNNKLEEIRQFVKGCF